MPRPIYRVKKYPNRRLYSVADSCYVTVPTVAQAIKDGCELIATEHKGGADITRQLLLEVLIYEQELRPTLPPEFLHHLVRNKPLELSDYLASAIATGAPK